jgi:plasmid maintenance system antidote protein VapI
MGISLAPDVRDKISKSGRSLTATARHIGISHGQLSNALAGRRRLSPPAAARLADLLEVDLPALVA